MRPLSLLPAFVLSCTLAAQCTFTPTVGPTGIILCPFATDTLTTQVYDSYQWYRNGQPIPGATQRALPVAYQTDAGYRFSVAATQNGCTALSDTVLVDGWAFPTMLVTSAGDPPRAVDNGGILRFCVGDTAKLALNHPYTASITWFRDGVPLPGELAPTLVVTTDGSYTAHAAPGLCPAVVFALGLSVPVTFEAPQAPTIIHVGGTLCAQPFANDHTWYLDGVPVDVGTCHEPQQYGTYTVEATGTYGCTALSTPYLHLATGLPSGDATAPYAVQVLPSDLLRVQPPAHSAPATHWRITDVQGRTLRNGIFTGELNLPLHDLANGVLLFQPLNAEGPVAPATRFVLAR